MADGWARWCPDCDADEANCMCDESAEDEVARDRRTGTRLPCVIVRSKNTQWPWRCTVCESLYSTPEGFVETTPTGDLRCPRARRFA